jgi:predicted dehydrogenase
MNDTTNGDGQEMPRRNFLKTAVVGTAGMSQLMNSENFAYAAGSDKIRVGVIGCGGRGSGAAVDSVKSSDGVEIAAMGDLFRDRLESSKKNLREAIGEKLTATEETCFVGFDAYKKVLETDVDYVILATPPGFRPIHIRAAIEAGKHVFAEKPVAIDSAGVRSVMKSADLADEKNLAIVVGTQSRHNQGYIETMKRIHDGQIGEVLSAHLIRLGGGVWLRPRKPGMSDMEWQCRNWYYFTWLSGDGIVEQQIHHIDVANWAMQSHPEKAVGVGGRQVRVDPSYGHIFDHISNKFVYPNGAHVNSVHRHWEGTENYSGEQELVVGSNGRAVPGKRIEGKNSWTFEKELPMPMTEQEHADLIASIRSGDPLNEGHRMAESTLTAIMGREAAYTGQEVTWEEVLNADLDLVPKTFSFRSMPFPPVPTPGETELNRTREDYA